MPPPNTAKTVSIHPQTKTKRDRGLGHPSQLAADFFRRGGFGGGFMDGKLLCGSNAQLKRVPRAVIFSEFFVFFYVNLKSPFSITDLMRSFVRKVSQLSYRICRLQ